MQHMLPVHPASTLQGNRESVALAFLHRDVKRKPVNSCQYGIDVSIEHVLSVLCDNSTYPDAVPPAHYATASSSAPTQWLRT